MAAGSLHERGCRPLVVGAGLVGLGTAIAFLELRPDADVLVVDKEPELAMQKSGRNSGVIHAGLCYPPGSLAFGSAAESVCSADLRGDHQFSRGCFLACPYLTALPIAAERHEDGFQDRLSGE